MNLSPESSSEEKLTAELSSKSDTSSKPDDTEEIEQSRAKSDDSSEKGDFDSDDDDLIEDGETEYCLCRSTDSNRFMIQCDHCKEWYHGDCIEVSKSFAKHIETYFCPPCIARYNQLEIVYTDKYKKSMAKRVKLSKSMKTTNTPSTVVLSADEEEVPQPRCNNCLNCRRIPDCGVCKWCISKKGRCVNVECLSVITMDDTETIKNHKPSSSRDRSSSDEDDEDEVFTPSSSCRQSHDKAKRGRKKGWRKEKHIISFNDKSPSQDKPSPIKQSTGYFDHTTEIPYPRPGYDMSKATRLDVASLAYATWQDIQGSKRKGVRGPIRTEPMQCIGPDCTNEARDNSKYCSDECGMNLAEARLKGIFPLRLKEYWEHVPFAKQRAEAMRSANPLNELLIDSKSVN